MQGQLEARILSYADVKGVRARAETECALEVHSSEEHRFPTRTRDDQDLLVKLRIRNELHGVTATIDYNGQRYPLTLLATPDAASPLHVFRWSVPEFAVASGVEADLPFTITVTDFVGNSDTYTGSLFMDLTPPDVSAFTIDVLNAPVRRPEEGFFATRITQIQGHGTFRDADVTHAFIIPGSYNTNTRHADARKDATLSAVSESLGFDFTMAINGPANAETLNTYAVYIRDSAGYEVQRPMSVLADTRAPEVLETTIT